MSKKIDEEAFRKTEGHLYGYFRELDEIKYLEACNKELEEQKEWIEKDIKNCNVYVDPTKNMGISYSEKVQTSSTGESAAERGIITEIENLEREKENVDREMRANNAYIRELKKRTALLNKTLNVPPLSEESRKFVEYKYKESEDGKCKSVEWIANEIYGGVRSTAYRKREDIVESIAQWEKMYLNVKK